MAVGVFHFLRLNIVHLHTDTDVNFRSEINGYTQKLFDRLRAGTATLSKGIGKAVEDKADRLPIPNACFQQQNTAQNNPLLAQLRFIVWYVAFLEWELRSTASYQRRITALQSLTIVLRSGIDPSIPQSCLSKSAHGQLNWAHGIEIATPKLRRILMDLILDPFDDIRGSAVSVLQLCSLATGSTEQTTTSAFITQFLQRAETTQLRTGRADQADGVARGYLLLSSSPEEHQQRSARPSSISGYATFLNLTNELRSTLSYAAKDLPEAINARPVHGIFAALRYVRINRPSRPELY